MSYKPIDGAKEDFRKYLDRKGVMDALTKAFVLCYDERPENPIDRLVEVVAENAKLNVGAASTDLRTRLMNTEIELKHAKTEIEVLRKQLQELGVTPASVPCPSVGTIAATNASQQPPQQSTPAPAVGNSNNSTAAVASGATETENKSTSTTSEAATSTGAIPKVQEPTTAANSKDSSAEPAIASAKQESSENASSQTVETSKVAAAAVMPAEGEAATQTTAS